MLLIWSLLACEKSYFDSDSGWPHDSAGLPLPVLHTGLDSGDSGWDPDSGLGEGEEDCPAGLICVDALPYEDRRSTEEGSWELDAYGCAPSTDESGPEIIYQVEIHEAGFLALSLRDIASDVDVDIHLLSSLDPEDCYDRGHWSAGAWVPAGVYYVVADSWVSSSGEVLSGEYSLEIGHTSPEDLEDAGMQLETAELALQALDRAWEEDWTESLVYGMIDFTLHSSLERLWIWNLAREELLWWQHVSHGEGSSDPDDRGYAVTFSNTPDSHQSSLGMAVSAELYEGGNGLSMRLDGLEPGYNDLMRDRYIVMHGADYARPEYVDSAGRLGQSWGCPAVDDRINDELVSELQYGYLWSYYPDGDWSQNSSYLP